MALAGRNSGSNVSWTSMAAAAGQGISRASSTSIPFSSARKRVEGGEGGGINRQPSVEATTSNRKKATSSASLSCGRSVHGRDRDRWSGPGPVEHGHIIRLVYQAWCFLNIPIHIKALSNKTVAIQHHLSIVDLLRDSLKDDKPQ